MLVIFYAGATLGAETTSLSDNSHSNPTRYTIPEPLGDTVTGRSLFSWSVGGWESPKSCNPPRLLYDTEWACGSSQICFPLFTQAAWLDPSSTFPQASSLSFLLLKRISCAGQGSQGRGSKPPPGITSLLKNHPSLSDLLTNRRTAKAFKPTPVSRIISPTLPPGTPCCSCEVPPPHTFCPRLLLSFPFTSRLECASPAGQCFPQLFGKRSHVTP